MRLVLPFSKSKIESAMIKTIPLILCLAATSAHADVTATFRDGAPVDRFTFAPQDTCLTGPVIVAIDLSGSDAGLIFDITA